MKQAKCITPNTYAVIDTADGAPVEIARCYLANGRQLRAEQDTPGRKAAERNRLATIKRHGEAD